MGDETNMGAYSGNHLPMCGSMAGASLSPYPLTGDHGDDVIVHAQKAVINTQDHKVTKGAARHTHGLVKVPMNQINLNCASIPAGGG